MPGGEYIYSQMVEMECCWRALRRGAALTALLAAGALVGCTGSSSSTPAPPAQSPITAVTVTCSPTSILLTQTSTCSAVVQGTGTFSSAFSWGVNGGSISPSGVFTPASTGTATITAISVQDSTKSGSTSVVVTSPIGISSLAPASLAVGSPAQTLTINGSGFVSNSTVTFNGIAHAATYVSATQLTILLTAADLTAAGSYPVVVANPAPGAGTSAPFNFTVYTPNPAPSITSFTPLTLPAGAAAQSITVNGAGFLPASAVTFNGVAHAATYLNAGQLSVALTAADLLTAGSYPVVVTNPAPGGGSSTPVNFTVTVVNPVPVISLLSPSSLVVASTPQTLTISGSGFLPASTATFNGVPHAVTYFGSGQLTIGLTTADLAATGSYAVVVTNPTPGGGASTPVNFTVSPNPVPAITSLSPASLIVASTPQNLTIAGTGFVPASTVTFNGVAHAATYESGTQLTIALTATDLAAAGSFPVVVTNPAPGGGPSTAVNFTVSPNPVPAITSLSPSAVAVGAPAQPLSILGTGFLPTSTATFNGAARTVTYASATQLSIMLTAADLTTAGSYPVVVTNPAPGGGQSVAVNLTVSTPNPVPAIASFSPGFLTEGASPQTLVIKGSGFVSNSTVTFNGAAHPATYVSASELTIAVTSADLATAGSYPVVVTNPAPGGGTSVAAFFPVIGSATANQWTWMDGGSTVPAAGQGQPGVYGNKGTASAGNVPGGRNFAASWADGSGHFWLFGGEGADSTGTLGVLNDLWEFTPSNAEWTWMGGANTASQGGVYGAKGTPAALNAPGSRLYASTWTDSSGNLWLFGGQGSDSSSDFGVLNDLWEYIAVSRQWEWVAGSSTVGAAGGQSGVYGALLTPALGNTPGSRYTAMSWTDASGNLWLFGGYGFDSTGTQGMLNDLWEFTPANPEWTWMGGSSTVPAAGGTAGVYGALTTAAPGNLPGSRQQAATWTDANGNLWLFGGFGFDANGVKGNLNDLWEFNPTTKYWAWMGGSSTVPCAGCGSSGVYGVLDTPDPANVPGARTSAVTWTDSSGNLWLFGGTGIDGSGNFGSLNDLWEFNTTNLDWTWMGGSNTVPAAGGTAGVYGALTTPAAANQPGSRLGGNAWTDTNGYLWLFGGNGYDASGVLGYLNDMWRYIP